MCRPPSASSDPNGRFAEIDDGEATVKVRGNSTSSGAKKPYNIKLSSKKTCSEWAARKSGACWRTCTTRRCCGTSCPYDFAAEIGMDYVSSCEFAELYLNGVYRGCYLLTEAVEIGETRVDLLEDGNEFPAGIRAVSRYSNPISFYTPITTCSSASTTPPTPLPRSSGG